jgi:dipeptidyl aminopeptidase/acylaminoacyl peptidase
MSLASSLASRAALVAAISCSLAHAAERRPTPRAPHAARVLSRLVARACDRLAALRFEAPAAPGSQTQALLVPSTSTCGTAKRAEADPASAASGAADGVSDGTLLGRARIAEAPSVAVDVVAYASSGLAVGGVVCYPNDGQRHSAVIHVPGGLGGVFVQADGALLRACIDWAALHGRTAFAPSLRGHDGGDGAPELCLGEADDVVAGAAMLRSLEVTDPARVGLVGGSIGGCTTLRAGPRIPDLAAVVAFVPPTSWKDLVAYHRTAWAPAVETTCEGTTREWSLGGPPLADALDALICGHPDCPDADYLARSPLAYVAVQTAPTLIVSAESDNVVPLEQQLLWSEFRQLGGQAVTVLSVDPCDPPGTPPLDMDVHVLSRHSFHLLAGGPISSGMLFLMAQLDARAAAGAP